jgi:glutamate-ammonia-ligase adenylyltransferase
MSDLSRLNEELKLRYPEPWVALFLGSFSNRYFESFAVDELARHLGLLMALNDQQPVALRAVPAGEREWNVEVIGYDAFQFLSTVCSLFALSDLTIVDGRIYTSHPPPHQAPTRRPDLRLAATRRPPRAAAERSPDRRKRIVDVFRVRLVEGVDVEPDWERVRGKLIELMRWLREGRHEEVHHRLLGQFVAALGRHRHAAASLDPLELTIDLDQSERSTVVRINAQDHFGFLSLTASALALCGIMIDQADIRTYDGRVDDTLWVNDRWGKKLTAEPELRELKLSLILIEHFSAFLPYAPNPEAALVHFSRFANETMARPDWADDFQALDRPEVLAALVRVLGESDFLWEDFLHTHPENLLPMVCDPSEWERPADRNALALELHARLESASTFDERRRVIRACKEREIFRTGLRAILGRVGRPEPFSAELTGVAEVILTAAYQVAHHETAKLLPVGRDGMPIPSVLCALGKCGGSELGFGSDIELMLVYDDRDMGDQAVGASIGAGFDRMVASLRNLLTDRRGATFEVDFRLRPYGRSGPPATAISAFADYYRAGGAAWGYERQALIKLRPIAGSPELGRAIEGLRDQFVYGPEPFDLQGARHLRRLQIDQLVKAGTLNAKYGPGGIVEVEYFTQALQIAHGAHDTSLRSPNTARAIDALAAGGWLGAEDAATLHSGYLFLRLLVDALRVVHGHSKDLTMPAFDSDEFAQLARRMNGREPASVGEELRAVMRSVHGLWEALARFLAPRSRPDAG